MIINKYPLVSERLIKVGFEPMLITHQNTDGEITFSFSTSEKKEEVSEEVFVESAKDHVLKILCNPSKAEYLHSCLIENLRKCMVYKGLYSKMPAMRKVPAILKYRKNFKVFQKQDKNYLKLETEIKEHGVFLNNGQVLFHGGDWPLKVPQIGQTVIFSKVFSTTLDPHVARVHSLYPPSSLKCIWHIRLENMTQPVFVCHPNRGGLKHEFEVMLVSNLCAKVADIISTENGMILDIIVSDNKK